MKNGGEPAIIQRWSEVAGAETDVARRGDSALAEVFAGAVGRRDLWSKALEAFKMNESPVAREWRAEARREGKIESLLLALEERFTTVPEEVKASIQSSTDGEQLNRWMRLAVSPSVTSLDDFRHKAGL